MCAAYLVLNLLNTDLLWSITINCTGFIICVPKKTEVLIAEKSGVTKIFIPELFNIIYLQLYKLKFIFNLFSAYWFKLKLNTQTIVETHKIVLSYVLSCNHILCMKILLNLNYKQSSITLKLLQYSIVMLFYTHLPLSALNSSLFFAKGLWFHSF